MRFRVICAVGWADFWAPTVPDSGGNRSAESSTFATANGSSTVCSQARRTICSFPQHFPPCWFLSNCYIDFTTQNGMESPKQKPNDLVLYRRRMGFTQRYVARLLGHRDTSMVSHYERSRVLPPLMTALSLEIIYRVPVAFLFPGMYDELKKHIRAQEESLRVPGQRPLF